MHYNKCHTICDLALRMMHGYSCTFYNTFQKYYEYMSINNFFCIIENISFLYILSIYLLSNCNIIIIKENIV